MCVCACDEGMVREIDWCRDKLCVRACVRVCKCMLAYIHAYVYMRVRVCMYKYIRPHVMMNLNCDCVCRSSWPPLT